MTEMHERLWHEWYDLWHETDASASKPSYEDWLESRIEELERAVESAIPRLKEWMRTTGFGEEFHKDESALRLCEAGLSSLPHSSRIVAALRECFEAAKCLEKERRLFAIGGLERTGDIQKVHRRLVDAIENVEKCKEQK